MPVSGAIGNSLGRVAIPRCNRLAAAVALLGLLVAENAPAGENWLPVSPEELQLKSLAEAPGAAAVYLYRQVDRNDADFSETSYVRIKILTSEGRKYGNVEIRFVKDLEDIRGIEARTICVVGKVVRFDGTVYETPMVAARGAKLLAKTFTLPGVEPGCIVEYRYRRVYETYAWVFNSQWILNADLFTKAARFSLVPNSNLSLRWTWPNGLPVGSEPPRLEKGRVHLEAHDVPAFVKEDHMPPEGELQMRVDFVYENNPKMDSDPKIYWQKIEKDSYTNTEHFVDKSSAMQEAVAQIVLPGDPPEVKLRKIYARTQRIRNLSFERERSAQEREREGLHNANNVAEVWKHNAGTGIEIAWLFMALCRTAEVPADGAWVSTRDRYRFDPRVMNPRELNSNVIIVALDGKPLFLDPGTPYTPFGQLPWNKTDSQALRLNKDGGQWIATPMSNAADALIERQATLTLNEGQLQGRLIVRFVGQEAAVRRLDERHADETERRQFLEHEIEDAVPTGTEVKLTNSPDWGSSDDPLIAEYELKVPGWATHTGRHQLIPVGLFGNLERHTLDHADRIQPIWFDYPSRQRDDIAIAIPAGWHVESLPPTHAVDLKAVLFNAAASASPPSIHLTRELTRNFFYAERKSYPALHGFFQTVRTSDEEQVVLAPDSAAHP